MTDVSGSTGIERRLLRYHHFISIGLNAFGGMQCFAASRENFSVGIDVVFFQAQILFPNSNEHSQACAYWNALPSSDLPSS
jgi:hypothetical protein